MSIIKLDAIASTNTFLKEMISKQTVEDFTVVTAKYQSNGKGQMGAKWTSEPSKNLMFSMFVDTSSIYLEYPFYLSMLAALAVRQSLNSFSIPQLYIKWPNDILSQNKKVCGILIENVMKQGRTNASIIGVGLNVNQNEFRALPNAASLKHITGCTYNLDELLDSIIFNLKCYVSKFKSGHLEALKKEYELYLFRKDKPSTFKDAKGNMFSGFITSIEETGSLNVLLEDNISKSFILKDITLIY